MEDAGLTTEERHRRRRQNEVPHRPYRIDFLRAPDVLFGVWSSQDNHNFHLRPSYASLIESPQL